MDKTPGSKALAMKDDVVFKIPIGTPFKKAKEKILDEETYVEKIGKIIQRDFFPDLEKLKAQNEYLEALEKNDVRKLRELYAKYSGTRPPTQRIPSPATFETPTIDRRQDDDLLPNQDASNNNTNSRLSEMDKDTRLTLDQFLISHTSQDNRSFQEILVESERKHREKYSYLYNEEQKTEEEKNKQLALPSIEQQCALPIKPLNVDTWHYKNRNHIMYVPDGVPMDAEKMMELSKNRQIIKHTNTRLERTPFDEKHNKETIEELAKNQAKILDGKIGVDGKELVKTTPKIGGFSFVRTPSPAPGGMDTPLMTWGEIEGTPFRLDGSDTPLCRSQGPAFKMAEPPKREQLAMALAERVSEQNRDKKKKAMDAARRHLASPSPRMGIDRLATMSPAARRLATSTALRFGDFTPSPLRGKTVAGAATPTRNVIKRHVTPKLNLGIRRSGDNNDLTDDLLKIDLPKRQKAADFF